MRRLLATALVASLALVAPTQAASLSGMGAMIFGDGFNFTRPNLAARPITSITAGPLAIGLQQTRLSDVRRAFGGTMQSGGGATWLCYFAEGANSWFISNAAGGQEFVMMVAVEAATRPAADCEANDSFAPLAFNVPGLGAGTAELRAQFGAASGNRIAYRHDRPGPYADVGQYLGYVLRSGRVTGIGLGETSVPTAH